MPRVAVSSSAARRPPARRSLVSASRASVWRLQQAEYAVLLVGPGSQRGHGADERALNAPDARLQRPRGTRRARPARLRGRSAKRLLSGTGRLGGEGLRFREQATAGARAPQTRDQKRVADHEAARGLRMRRRPAPKSCSSTSARWRSASEARRRSRIKGAGYLERQPSTRRSRKSTAPTVRLAFGARRRYRARGPHRLSPRSLTYDDRSAARAARRFDSRHRPPAARWSSAFSPPRVVLSLARPRERRDLACSSRAGSSARAAHAITEVGVRLALHVTLAARRTRRRRRCRRCAVDVDAPSPPTGAERAARRWSRRRRLSFARVRLPRGSRALPSCVMVDRRALLGGTGQRGARTPHRRGARVRSRPAAFDRRSARRGRRWWRARRCCCRAVLRRRSARSASLLAARRRDACARRPRPWNGRFSAADLPAALRMPRRRGDGARAHPPLGRRAAAPRTSTPSTECTLVPGLTPRARRAGSLSRRRRRRRRGGRARGGLARRRRSACRCPAARSPSSTIPSAPSPPTAAARPRGSSPSRGPRSRLGWRSAGAHRRALCRRDGERLYLTGDLAQWDGGELRLVGRADRQDEAARALRLRAW